ncbi:hypothetical protein AWB83_02811 [Caballeronia ptereochthonis]|uniref:Uncharacterized protein n=1 Tax=Caballeronia ptereochthonis TaxID=1777144 RepID=A0A158B5K6_9BURK|nr:hypothetical protein AWB83_02811 [Caballeronia ptereochthonis]
MLMSPRLKRFAPFVLLMSPREYRFNCDAAAMTAAAPSLTIDCVPVSVTSLPMIVARLVSVALVVVTVLPSMRPWFVIALAALTVVLAEFRSAPA